GQNLANPISQVLTGALMLDHLGEHTAADLVRGAVDAALASGNIALDERGRARGGTKAAGRTIADTVRSLTLKYPRRMTGPHPDEDEQHVVIYVDASATAHLEAPDATPPPIERPGAMRQQWAAAVVGVVLGLLLVSAHVPGDPLYNLPSRLPDLVFTRDAG